MFFKTATVACSLAALLVVGCDTDDNEIEDRDTIVAPGDDYSPAADPVPTDSTTTEPDIEDPATTSPDFDLTPERDGSEPATSQPSDLDEPVVEEVEADSLPEEEE